MIQLIETICFEKGEFQNLNFHNERLNRSRWNLLDLMDEILLEEVLLVPAELSGNKIKCRILYGQRIERIEYQTHEIRPIHSLTMVNGDHINYEYKYADRNSLNALVKLKGMADEVLIVKNGFITDISYANIILLKGDEWYTPLNPLLKGIRRESYLNNGRIKSTLIRPGDLKEFTEVRIINAMISMEESMAIPIENINSY